MSALPSSMSALPTSMSAPPTSMSAPVTNMYSWSIEKGSTVSAQSTNTPPVASYRSMASAFFGDGLFEAAHRMVDTNTDVRAKNMYTSHMTMLSSQAINGQAMAVNMSAPPSSMSALPTSMSAPPTSTSAPVTNMYSWSIENGSTVSAQSTYMPPVASYRNMASEFFGDGLIEAAHRMVDTNTDVPVKNMYTSPMPMSSQAINGRAMAVNMSAPSMESRVSAAALNCNISTPALKMMPLHSNSSSTNKNIPSVHTAASYRFAPYTADSSRKNKSHQMLFTDHSAVPSSLDHNRKMALITEYQMKSETLDLKCQQELYQQTDPVIIAAINNKYTALQKVLDAEAFSMAENLANHHPGSIVPNRDSFPGPFNTNGLPGTSTQQFAQFPASQRDSFPGPFNAHQLPATSAPQMAQPYMEPWIQREKPKISRLAKRIMKRFYERNVEHPYPTSSTCVIIAQATGQDLDQIKKWFNNRRRRDKKTKSFTQIKVARKDQKGQLKEQEDQLRQDIIDIKSIYGQH